MRLLLKPIPELEVFKHELELVIQFVDGALPDVYWPEGMPRPDKHLLLGVIQTASMAVSEQDKEAFVLTPACQVILMRDNAEKLLSSDLVIVRSEEGKLGVLAIGDMPTARRRIREVVRYFTGTVRLDIP